MSAEYMRYADVEELQSSIMQSGGEPDLTANERGLYEMALDSTSRAVDMWCRRFFYQVTQTHTFTASLAQMLVVPDLVTISTNGLKTDTSGDGTYDRTWSTSDYILEPQNAPRRETGWPYTEIHVSYLTGSSNYVFEATQKGVQIAATWGWPAVPDVVHDVTILEAARLIKSFESPSGVITLGTQGGGTVGMKSPKMHPLSMRVLSPYRRMAAVPV